MVCQKQDLLDYSDFQDAVCNPVHCPNPDNPASDQTLCRPMTNTKEQATMPEYYLGIDPGWSESDATTGLCLITIDQTEFRWELKNTTSRTHQRLADLRRLIPHRTNLKGVGIDGPLASGLRVVSCYRAAEALLNRGLLQERCKLGQTHSGNGQHLHHQASLLANLILRLQNEGHLDLTMAHHPQAIHGSCVVEAYPDAFLAFLLSDRDFDGRQSQNEDDERSDRYWETAVENRYLHDLIERLAPGRLLEERLNDITHHEHRAAFVCALSATCVSRRNYVAAGAPECGDIILPPRKVWGADAAGQGSWAEPTLRANVQSVRQDCNQNDPCENFNQARVICDGHQWMPEPEQ